MPDALAEVLHNPHRLAALNATGLLDGPANDAFDRLTALAARILDAPVALVSLVDSDRQVFASCLGLPEPWVSHRETPLSHSFCQHTLTTGAPLVNIHNSEFMALLCAKTAFLNRAVIYGSVML